MQNNLGKTGGPQMWERVTESSANKVFSVESTAENDWKPKATDEAKESLRRNKYSTLQQLEKHTANITAASNQMILQMTCHKSI